MYSYSAFKRLSFWMQVVQISRYSCEWSTYWWSEWVCLLLLHIIRLPADGHSIEGVHNIVSIVRATCASLPSLWSWVRKVRRYRLLSTCYAYLLPPIVGPGITGLGSVSVTQGSRDRHNRSPLRSSVYFPSYMLSLSFWPAIWFLPLLLFYFD